MPENGFKKDEILFENKIVSFDTLNSIFSGW